MNSVLHNRVSKNRHYATKNGTPLSAIYYLPSNRYLENQLLGSDDVRQILHAVKGWIRGESSKGRKTAMVYVYSPGKETQNGELGANDQISLLRRLSTFVSKETLPVTIIFPGRPTRKIPDGASQSGVQVRYATTDQMKKVVGNAIAEAKKEYSVVLATNSPELEKIARSERIRHIRATTFEEALNAICGPLRRDQPQQQPQRRQPQSAPAQKSQPSPESNGDAGPEAPATQPQANPISPKPEPVLQRHRRNEAPSKKEDRDQDILNLIDPL
jgi:hypothetical protein